MNKFIRNNFLAICITLSVIFAFSKKTTIFQQDKPQTPANVIVQVNQETNQVFQKHWKNQDIENTKFILIQDSVTIGEATLSYTLKDFGKDQPNGAIPSLSSNFTQKISQKNYHYSENSTVITPLNTPRYAHALSIISSSQSNDGTDFLSLQHEPKSYLFVGRNSTEQEKEIHRVTEKGNLEDEIWTKIRMNPDALPQGEFEMIPSLGYWNKTHESPNAQEVKAELKSEEGNPKLKIYSLDYPEIKRKLDITFGVNPPYRIYKFEETIEGKKIIANSKLISLNSQK
ncbi:MAG: hypothetical protein U5N85_17295 [Arcicella sp.]|nr:hypothetical protein [Arcicella sp.]